MHLFESSVCSLIILKSKALNSFSYISVMPIVWGSLIGEPVDWEWVMASGYIIVFVLFYTSIGVGLSLSFAFFLSFPFFQVYLDDLFSVTLPRGISTRNLLLIVGWSC